MTPDAIYRKPGHIHEITGRGRREVRDNPDNGGLLEFLLRERILILDGAMGTMVQQLHLDEAAYRGVRFAGHDRDLRGNHDLLNLTQPEVVKSIHQQYLSAGADIIETNTFNSNPISLADYHLEDFAYEINLAAARLARSAVAEAEAVDPSRPRFVAGSIGPTNRTASISPDVNNPGFRAVTFDQLIAAYNAQVRGLLAGGVDILLVETAFDTLNAKAALFAIDSCGTDLGRQVPVMISMTITDASGRTLSGQTPEAFWVSVSHAALLSVGINCALGPADLRAHLEDLSELVPVYLSCHPNAGLPNELGGYDQTPEEMARILGEYAANGWLNIVGGCCGTTPAHIRAIARAISGYLPRVPAVPKPYTRLSGLEDLTIRPEANFINVGERTNVAGSPKFARLILEGKYEDALAVARQQVEGGAQLLDVNMDEAMLDSEAAMTRFLNLVKALADRLAEAFAESLHKNVREEWGYGRDEKLTLEDLIKERYRGIRPAPGYPACPDHTEKRGLFDLLKVEERVGVLLTESFAMLPASSVCGYYFAHPESRYFSVGKIGRDQVFDYAERKGMDRQTVERWLAPNLGYDPESSTQG